MTDGEPVVFREFVTAMLATQGVSVPDKSVPAGVAGAAAVVSPSGSGACCAARARRR